MLGRRRQENQAAGRQPGAQSTRDGDRDGDGMQGWLGAKGAMMTEAMTTMVLSGGI